MSRSPPSRSASTLHPSDAAMIDGLPADLMTVIPNVSSSSALYEMSKLPRAQSGLVKAAIMKQVKRLDRRARKERERRKWAGGDNESVSTVGSEEARSQSFHAGQTSKVDSRVNSRRFSQTDTKKSASRRYSTKSWDFRSGDSSGEDDDGASSVRSLSTIESSAVSSFVNRDSAPPTTPRPSNAVTAYVRSHVDLSQGGLVIARKDSSMEEISQNLYALFINNAVLNPKGRRAINGRNRGLLSLLEHARVVKSSGQKRAELRAKQWNSRERRKAKGGRDMFRALRRACQGYLAMRFLQLKMGADMVKAVADMKERQEVERKERQKQWAKQSRDTAAMLLWNTCVKIGRRRMGKGWGALVGNVERWQVVGRLLLRLAKIKVMSAMGLWKIKTKTAKADDTLKQALDRKRLAGTKLIWGFAGKVMEKILKAGWVGLRGNMIRSRGLEKVVKMSTRQMMECGFKALTLNVTNTALKDLDKTTNHARELKSQLSVHLDNLRDHAASEIYGFFQRVAAHKVRRAFYVMLSQCEGAGELRWVLGKVVKAGRRRVVMEWFRKWEREARWRGRVLERRRKGCIEIIGIRRRQNLGEVRRAFYTLLSQCDGAVVLKKAFWKVLKTQTRKVSKDAWVEWRGFVEEERERERKWVQKEKAGVNLVGVLGREWKKSHLREGMKVWRLRISVDKEVERKERVKNVGAGMIGRVWKRGGMRLVGVYWERWARAIEGMKEKERKEKEREEAVERVVGRVVGRACSRGDRQMVVMGWNRMMGWTRRCSEHLLHLDRSLAADRLASLIKSGKLQRAWRSWIECCYLTRIRDVHGNYTYGNVKSTLLLARKVMERVVADRMREAWGRWRRNKTRWSRGNVLRRLVKGVLIGRLLWGWRSWGDWVRREARRERERGVVGRVLEGWKGRELVWGFKRWKGEVGTTKKREAEEAREREMREIKLENGMRVVRGKMKERAFGCMGWGFKRWKEEVESVKKREEEEEREREMNAMKLKRGMRVVRAKMNEMQFEGIGWAFNTWACALEETKKREEEEEREREMNALKLKRGMRVVRAKINEMQFEGIGWAFNTWAGALEETKKREEDEEREREMNALKLKRGMRVVRAKINEMQFEGIGWAFNTWACALEETKKREEEEERVRVGGAKALEGRTRRVKTVVRIRVLERYRREVGWGMRRWREWMVGREREDREREDRDRGRDRFLRRTGKKIWGDKIREGWKRWREGVEIVRKIEREEEEEERTRLDREGKVRAIIRGRLKLLYLHWLREGFRRWESGVLSLVRSDEFLAASRRKARMAVGLRVRQFERDGLVHGWVRWVRHTHGSLSAAAVTRGGSLEAEGRERAVRALVRGRLAKRRMGGMGRAWKAWLGHVGRERGEEARRRGWEVNVRRTVRRALMARYAEATGTGFGRWREFTDRAREGERREEEREEERGRREKMVRAIIRQRVYGREREMKERAMRRWREGAEQKARAEARAKENGRMRERALVRLGKVAGLRETGAVRRRWAAWVREAGRRRAREERESREGGVKRRAGRILGVSLGRYWRRRVRRALAVWAEGTKERRGAWGMRGRRGRRLSVEDVLDGGGRVKIEGSGKGGPGWAMWRVRGGAALALAAVAAAVAVGTAVALGWGGGGLGSSGGGLGRLENGDVGIGVGLSLGGMDGGVGGGVDVGYPSVIGNSTSDELGEDQGNFEETGGGGEEQEKKGRRKRKKRKGEKDVTTKEHFTMEEEDWVRIFKLA
ncbi:hypothetical protein TrCOL_g12097 [Triparma columacea]|uniref:Uncharacterized protein n=1 Tax=Triparma columacea TaxID=722753 RepID=A0A9W7GQA6_9STRA|nr:hypothetical protein TrCOL_g12097 [Triparma columacea]